MEGFGSKEAFYPVLEAVGRLCRGPDGARVVDTLATEAPTWLVQFPALLTRQHRETLRQEILGATRERMLREICEALAAVSARSPLLLVLEDLHWGDSSTLDLISALARHRPPARIMLLATYRPSEAAGSTLPLDALKRDLVARHLGREIVLPPLTDAEIAQYLAEGQSAATVPEELVSLLHRHTEGNPLFMITVLEHMLKAGLVEHEPRRVAASAFGERDRRAGSGEPAADDRGADRAAERAGAARTGGGRDRRHDVRGGDQWPPRPIWIPSPSTSAATLSRDADHILRLAGTQELPDGQVVQRYEFAHALYREVLYERQSPARRAMLHRRAAERMAELFAASLDDVAPELAHHFELGADWTRAVKYLRRVADVAGKQGAPLRAKANLEHALTLAARLPQRERVEAEVGILDALLGISIALIDPAAGDTATLLRERAAKYGLTEVEATGTGGHGRRRGVDQQRAVPGAHRAGAPAV